MEEVDSIIGWSVELRVDPLRGDAYRESIIVVTDGMYISRCPNFRTKVK